MILETIVGTNGIIVPPDGYLQSIREVCDRHGILLICDEVMAGFGRTGKWFACEQLGRRPGHPHGREGDQLRLRAGRRDGDRREDRRLGARQVLRRWADVLGPRAGVRRAAIASIEAVPRRRASSRTRPAMGEVLCRRTARLQERHPSIGEVRGKGCSGGSSWCATARRASRSFCSMPPGRRLPGGEACEGARWNAASI